MIQAELQKDWVIRCQALAEESHEDPSIIDIHIDKATQADEPMPHLFKNDFSFA